MRIYGRLTVIDTSGQLCTLHVLRIMSEILCSPRMLCYDALEVKRYIAATAMNNKPNRHTNVPLIAA
jgi:hypothetical protein